MVIYIFIASSYVCGCLNGAYYIGKWFFHKDVRSIGSYNAGARNAGRAFGQSAFIWTVIIDALKTAIPLCIAVFMIEVSASVLALSAIAIMVGHVWPVQLKGRGGKGVVVYLASALVLAPFALLPVAIIVLFGRRLKKRFTSSGLVALCSIPITLAFFLYLKLAFLFTVLLFIVLIAHRKEL